MKKWYHLTLMAISLTAISFAGFSDVVATKAQSQSVIKTIYIGPKLMDCTGVGSRPQRCYQYKENVNDNWQLLYGQIEGFGEYEEGFVYQLQVEVSNVLNPQTGAPSTKYKLIRILSKLPASPQPLAPNPLPASIVGKNWSLVTLQKSEQDVESIGGAEVTIMLDANSKVSGFDGCNGYSGVYDVGLNNEIEIEGVVSAKVGCSGSKTKLEAEYLAALEKVGSWMQDDPNRLQLKTNDDNTLGYVLAPEPGMPTTGGGGGRISPTIILTALSIFTLAEGLLLRSKARYQGK